MDGLSDAKLRLRNQFSEEQLRQLGAQIAFENYRARLNRVGTKDNENESEKKTSDDGENFHGGDGKLI